MSEKENTIRRKIDCLMCDFEIKLELDTSIESVKQRKIHTQQYSAKTNRMGEYERSHELQALYIAVQFVCVIFHCLLFLVLTFFFSDNGHKQWNDNDKNNILISTTKIASSDNNNKWHRMHTQTQNTLFLSYKMGIKRMFKNIVWSDGKRREQKITASPQCHAPHIVRRTRSTEHRIMTNRSRCPSIVWKILSGNTGKEIK